MNIIDSLVDLYDIIEFTSSRSSLSYIQYLVLENK